MTGFIKGRPDKVSAPYRRIGSVELTGEDYLRESLMCPNCYVVKGYDKDRTKGGSLIDDKVPFEPMPANHQSSMGLSPIEIDAVIAWLQYKDDRDLSKVTIIPPAGGYFLAPIDWSSYDAEYFTGEEDVDYIVRGGGCTLCHNIPGFGDWHSEAPTLHLKNNGPKRLKDPRYKGSAATIREYVKESIAKPSAYVVLNEAGENYPEGCMPPYISKRLSVGALEKIVDFIANTERPPYYKVEDPPYYIDTLPKNK
jgi:hypothetical protein